jgi:hypothetical protein
MKFCLYQKAVAVMAIAFLLFVVFTSNAKTHSWYENECCSEKDCSEVIDKQEDGHGNLIITSKNGTVLVAPEFPRKPSQDEKEHICTIGKLLICYYVPGGS